MKPYTNPKKVNLDVEMDKIFTSVSSQQKILRDGVSRKDAQKYFIRQNIIKLVETQRYAYQKQGETYRSYLDTYIFDRGYSVLEINGRKFSLHHKQNPAMRMEFSYRAVAERNYIKLLFGV